MTKVLVKKERTFCVDVCNMFYSGLNFSTLCVMCVRSSEMKMCGPMKETLIPLPWNKYLPGSRYSTLFSIEAEPNRS